VYANKPAHQQLRQILDDNFDAADSLPAMIEKATEKILYLDENNQPLAAEDYPPYIAMQTGRQSQLFIQRRYLKSNKTEWFLNTSVPLLDAEGKVEYIISTSVDFTPQKEAENKIRESEKRFRTLADTLPQMVWMRDMNGNMEYGSKYWHLYSGIDNVSEAWKAMVHPDDWQPVMQNWERHFNNGTPFTYEVRLKNKEDYYRWHQAFAEPLTDDNGNVVKWIGVVTDIHNQKSFAESLEREVAQRTKELARSNEDLQQFAHVASHDLKEPVRKVMTFASRLKEELGTRASEQAIRFLSKIEASAIRMYSMIDGVLLYSSLNALEQTKELIDLNELIENIKSDLEVPMSEKKAQILNGLLPSIEGSPILIYQLFYNLVNNSLKFAKSDVPPEIQIVQEAVLREDVKMLMPHKKYVKIVIEDNGIGFSNADAERIFATFTRLHSKDLYEGTGLGLSLCRKIVERQGGAIYATGEEGKGAKFSLLLPL
jgi:PAS domain S-box-containing protein